MYVLPDPPGDALPEGGHAELGEEEEEELEEDRETAGPLRGPLPPRRLLLVFSRELISMV